MVDYSILKRFGSTTEKIRKVFTCDDPESPHYEARKKFEERLRSRTREGITHSLDAYEMYAAADMAWDSSPIVRETLPLMLYAQKRISMDQCAKHLEGLKCADRFVVKDESGEVKDISLPKLYEVSVNLVRSYVTRRLAAQATRFAGLFPYFKYEPRSTSQVGKIRGDALSQRMEIMADQFGYRHLGSQIIRDVLLYGHSVVFPACSWERQVQWEKQRVDPEMIVEDDARGIESRVVREGVPFVMPHPTRTFWDNLFPLSSINTDTGCRWLGFWEIQRYSDIQSNPAYFNKDKIRFTEQGRQFYTRYGPYFNLYYNSTRITFPMPNPIDGSPAADNDRQNNIAYYTHVLGDSAMFVTEYYEKVVPADVGLGDYPFPVWLRLVVGSDETVIYGEFMPSRPGIYFGYNENDSRQKNISVAMELMPYQDQLTNLYSQILLTAKADLLKIYTLDIDNVSEEIRAAVKKTLESKDYYVHPLLLEYSGNKMRNLGVNATSPLTINTGNSGGSISQLFNVIGQLLSTVERLMVLSPQELGQPAPREISATEVSEISQSTNTVYGFISDAIDEGRAAWKQLLYESLIAKGSETIRVPVIGRYTNETVEGAGFSVEDSDDTESGPSQQTVLGTKNNLIFDYVFSSRDGGDRSINSQAAQTLTQLIGSVATIPEIAKALGKKKLFEMINEVFRLSGAGYDLKLEVGPEEADAIDDQQNQQIQSLTQAVTDIQNQIATFTQAAQQLMQQGGPGPSAPPAAPMAQPGPTPTPDQMFAQGAVLPPPSGNPTLF